jgi:hypothetical protein
VTTFEVVLIVVAVLGIGLALTPWFRPSRVMERIGRRGTTWFDHPGDLPVDERPPDDERDAPIPVRPLRGRPQ